MSESGELAVEPRTLWGLRRPSVAALAGALYLGVLAALYVNKPPNPDQSIFDYIGWIALSGGRYYVDVAEQNFPGEMWLHELAFRLFGVGIRAYRGLDFLILIAGAAALLGLLRRLGFGRAAWAGWAFYVAGYVSSNGWMSGQRDAVAANLLLVAGYSFTRRLEGGGRLTLMPVGPLVYFALLLRPTYLPFPIGLWLLDAVLLRRTGRRPITSAVDAATVLGEMVVCLALNLGWVLAAGAWPAFYEQALLFNTQAYGAGHSLSDTVLRVLNGLLGTFGLLLPAAALAIVGLPPRERWSAPLGVLLGMIVLALASAIVQKKGFGYHLGALIAPLFGLAGVAFWQVVERLREGRSGARWRALPALLCAVSGLFGLALQCKSLGPQLRYLTGFEPYTRLLEREGAGERLSWADLHAAAAAVRATTTPNDTILVWGRPVGLHLLAERRSPSRFITSGMLVLARPPFSSADAWNREFATALAEHPPAWIFVPQVDGKIDFGGFAPDDLERSPAIGAVRQAIAACYDCSTSFGSLLACRMRQDYGSAGGCVRGSTVRAGGDGS